MKRQEEKSYVFPLIQKHLLQKGGGEVKAKKPSNDYNYDKSRGKSKSRKEIKCFYYGKSSHIKRVQKIQKRTV